MKYAYKYHFDTKEFIGKVSIQLNPKNPTEYIYPAYTTDIVPPISKSGFAIIFDINKNKWMYIEDYRDKLYIKNGAIEKMYKLGKLPNGSRLLTEDEIIELTKMTNTKKNLLYQLSKFNHSISYNKDDISYTIIIHPNIISSLLCQLQLYPDKDTFIIPAIDTSSINIKNISIAKEEVLNILEQYNDQFVTYMKGGIYG